MIAADQLRARSLKSARWVLLRIGVIGGLQLLYFALMARTLDRTDFGEVSIVVALLMLCDVFTQTGVDVALIRHQGQVDQYLNAAWSVQVVRGLGLATLLAAFALPVAMVSGIERLAPLLLTAAAVPLIDGFQSIAMVLLARDLDQRRVTLAEMTSTVISIPIGYYLAVSLRSPWALIINMVLFALLRLVAMYCVYPHLPRFTFRWSILRPYARFSVFYNLAHGAWYLVASADRFVIGRLLGLDLLGLYDRCYNLSTCTLQQFPKFLAGTVYPTLARVLDQPPRYFRLLRRYLLLLATIATAGAAVMLFAAEPLVRVFIGPKFMDGVALFRVLALFVACRTATVGLHILFDLHARTSLRLIANLVTLAVLAGAIPIGVNLGGLIGAGVAVGVASAVGLVLTMIFMRVILTGFERAAAPMPSAASASVDDLALLDAGDPRCGLVTTGARPVHADDSRQR